MTDLHEYQLGDQFAAESGQVVLSGVQALVRAPLDQVRADRSAGYDTAGLITGYQGSPLGGVDLVYQRNAELMAVNQVAFHYGVNEELAATMVWGSQQAGRNGHPRHDGVVGLWFGKGPGLDRGGDAIRHGNAAGVSRRDGVIVAVGDDPACKSSTMPSASEGSLADLALPTLYPGSPQDVVDLGRAAYEMSRASGAWVGMKIHTDVADGTATVDVDPLRLTLVHEPFLVDGQPWTQTCNDDIIQPHALTQEHEAYEVRPGVAQHFAEVNGLDRIRGASSDAWLGIIAAGKPYFDLRSALAGMGAKSDSDIAAFGIRILKPALIWPLIRPAVRDFAAGVEAIMVIEEKRPFIEDQVRSILYGGTDAPSVIGKRDEADAPLVPAFGALDPDKVAGPLRSVLTRRIDESRLGHVRERIPVVAKDSAANALPSRTPYFCSGCPHNRSTAVPEGSTAGAGIGCHGMVLFVPGRAVGITQMGGEGAQWVGQEPFVTEPHRFQNIGDGTFAHSGSLAIRQSVASGTNITFKVLYNGTVAMTGGQDAAGEMSVPAMSRLLHAEGVGRISVVADDPDKYGIDAHFAPGVDIVHRDRLDDVQRELRDVSGTTVIIYDQRCAAELRRGRKRGTIETPTKRVFINEAVCDGCGHCGAVSNCMSVHPVDTPLGRKTRIHQESCNVDLTCLDGDCPAFITVTLPGAGEAAGVGSGARQPATAVPNAAESALVSGPLPKDPDVPAETSVLTVGIGGTGVVTVNQVLMAAAVMEGKQATSLDQTGLAQKGGPVVSHLRIGPGVTEGAARLAEAAANTYLIFDLVAGVAPANLSKAAADTTTAVVSTSRIPTGHMVADTARENFPALDAFVEAIDERTRAAENLWFDAEVLARKLFRSQPAANLILLGAAYQRGLIPLSGNAIERAVELNGVAVDMNLAAFRVGRRLADDPSLAAGLGSGSSDPEGARPTTDFELAAPESTRRAVGWRLPEVRAWGGSRWADRYLDTVRRIAETEAALHGDGTLAATVAHQLGKLMTYKDEYEVARLHRRPDLTDEIRATFGPGARHRFQLKPPTLVALGIDRKIGFGRFTGGTTFAALSRLRRLRGTPFDPFGRTTERKVERELITDYERLVDELIAGLTESNHAEAVSIAGLADQIRGFSDVKLANVANYRSELQHAFTRWRE